MNLSALEHKMRVQGQGYDQAIITARLSDCTLNCKYSLHECLFEYQQTGPLYDRTYY